MRKVWRIELLGTLRASGEGQSLARFRTRRVASLLAYLAFFRERVHSRDEIAQLLWPDADTVTSRRNLRQALSSLRLVLEPAGVSPGSVLLSIHDGVQLSAETVETDVSAFESLLDQGRKVGDVERSADLLRQAVTAYKGDLLPGFNDEWVWSQRLRLEDLYLSTLRKLSASEDPGTAIDHLRLGVIRAPFDERWHVELMERYLQIGRPDKALDQFAELEKALSDGFGQASSEQAQALAAQARGAIPGYGQPREISPKPPEQLVELPSFPNRYFGRTKEIEFVCSTLEESRSRLVTILGPAGVGKTRLSVQCAHAISGRQDWNIWFVPLADRFKASELYEGILAAMDAQHGSSSAAIHRIAELTGGRKTLLVLDNLEQIADDAGAFVAPMLAQIPNLICLASSRQPLQIIGEQVAAIEPLPLPDTEHRALEELSANACVQLFVNRCQAIRPEVRLNAGNAEAIVDLCLRLDGLPLALEIAAGLANSFSPSQMVSHLPLKLTGLTSRRRDVPARHKSLRAAIDWSYDSLAPELQRLFRQVCVFRGGFTLEAATAICFEGPDRTEECLAAMQGLQERSLVRSQPAEDGREPRFTLLTAFREYGEEEVSDDEILDLRERHAAFFVSKTPPDRPFANAEEQAGQHLDIELDYDNFTSAIEYSLGIGNVERCVRLLAILSVRWPARSPRGAERHLTKQVAERPELADLSSALRVRVQRMVGTICIRSGEYVAAYESMSKAVEIAAASGDPHLMATSLSGLSICAAYLGRIEECLDLNNRVLELVGATDLVLAERSHLGIGSIYGIQGKFEDAGRAFDRARAISEKQRGGEPDALIVTNQARIALDLGRRSEALRLIHEAIRISKRIRGEFTLAVALSVLSRYHAANDNLAAAVATNLEALEKFKQGDFLYFILQTLRNHALLWVKADRFSDAASLLAATDEISTTDSSADRQGVEAALEQIRASLTQDEYETAWARGLAMDRNEAIRLVSA